VPANFAGLTVGLDYWPRPRSRLPVAENPIIPPGDANGGYDITDYYNVHPRWAKPWRFRVFLQRRTPAGIRVIIDLVGQNHTSNEHVVSVPARSAEDSPRGL